MNQEAAGRTREQKQGRPSVQDTGAMRDRDQLAVRIGRFARSFQAEDDQGMMLDEVIQAAVELVPGASDGSISRVVNRRRVISDHSTGELPVKIEAVQTELGQGPCLDSIYEQQTVRLTDTVTEQRWPVFCRRANELGCAACSRSSCTSRGTTSAP